MRKIKLSSCISDEGFLFYSYSICIILYIFKNSLFSILTDNVLALYLEVNDLRKFIQSSLTDTSENCSLCAVLLKWFWNI